MSQWLNEINLKEVWKSENPSLIAKTIVDQLKLIRLNNNYLEFRRRDLIEEFEAISEDSATSIEDFDYLFEKLYDWADTSLDDKFGGKKVCWIATNF